MRFCNHSYFNIRLNCFILRLLFHSVVRGVLVCDSVHVFYTNSILYVDHIIITRTIHIYWSSLSRSVRVIHVFCWHVFTFALLPCLKHNRRRSGAELLSIYHHHHHFVYVILKVERIKIIRRKTSKLIKKKNVINTELIFERLTITFRYQHLWI